MEIEILKITEENAGSPRLRNGAGKRLDKFLAEKFPRYSRAFFQKLIKNGAVLSGGEKTEPKYI